MEQIEDTRTNHEEETRAAIAERCEEEVKGWTDHELIEYAKDYASDDFYDFIMEDLRQTYCKMAGRDPNILPTKLGGIPNLLIELFQPENYLAYFWDMEPEQQKKCRDMLAEHYADREINNEN